MTTTELIISLCSGGSLISMLVVRYLDRQKIKGDTEKTRGEMYDTLLKSVNNELQIRDKTIETLRKKDQENQDSIGKLGDQITKLRQQHRICEEDNLFFKTEIDWMKRLLSKTLGTKQEKVLVYVLDDLEIVTLSIKSKLERSALIEIVTFNEVENFLTEVVFKKPRILIMDYYLSKGMTAKNLIDIIKADPEYNPTIIIMSGDDGERVKSELQSKGITRFYLKEGLYIHDIVNFVMKYAEKILN